MCNQIKGVIKMITENAKEAALNMRKICKKNDDQRDAGLPTNIPEVERINNLQYGNDSTWNLLDIYLPKKRDGKVPTIIHIHGGGWCYGTKETYQFYGMNLAKNGFGFINFNYPLAPDVQFPKELDAVNQVFHWVANYGSEYDLDLNNVFISGDSAGGQMAEQYLTILCNDEYRKLFDYQKPALTVRAATFNCGAYFLKLPGIIEGAFEAYFPPEIVANNKKRLDTEKYMTPNMPPIFIMTANHDFLHDAAIRLDGYMIAKGINHELHIYGDENNPREHVFHINQRDVIAAKCNQDELEFYRKYLK